MADPRLAWRQLTQSSPNVSGLLSQSNNALNGAFTSAGDILGKYQAGREAKADAEVAQEIAALNDEAEFDAWLAKGGLRNRGVSKDMVDTLLGTRKDTLDYANDRSVTADRDGRLQLANNADARVQRSSDWDYNSTKENADLSRLAVAARSEGKQHGASGQPNDPTENYYSSVIGSESSGNPNARTTKEGQTSSGLAGFTDPTWMALSKRHPDLGLTMENKNDPEKQKAALRRFTEDNIQVLESANIPVNEGTLYQAHFLGPAGARRMAQAPDDAMARDYVSASALKNNPEVLANTTVGEFRRWAFEKGGGNNRPSPTRARDDFTQALANSQYQSLNAIEGLLDTNDVSIAEGDTRIAGEVAERNRNLAAQIANDVAANPLIVTPDDANRAVTDILRNNPNLSSEEELQIRDAVLELTGKGSLGMELAPDVPENLAVDEAINNTLNFERRAFRGTGQNTILSDVEKYAQSEDVYKALEADLALGANDPENAGVFGATLSGLGLGTDGRSGYDHQDLVSIVNDYAARLKVEPHVVAAAMRAGFEDDPFGFNTLGNRFDFDKVSKIVEQITPEARRDYERGSSNLSIAERKLRTLQSDRQKLEVQLKKAERVGADQATIRGLQARLSKNLADMAAVQLQSQVNTQKTP